MSKEKYRPVLSPEQITHIISLCKRDSSPESLNVIGALASFEYKIINGATKPAYIEKPKQSFSQKLGFDTPGPSEEEISDAINTEAIYNVWLTNPEHLNGKELTRVQAYRYENNKMTVSEENEYEVKVLGFPMHEVGST